MLRSDAPLRSVPAALLLAALLGVGFAGACRSPGEPPSPARDVPRSDAGSAVEVPGLTPVPDASEPLANGSALRIHDVQGGTHVSPYAGALVRDLRGIVTCLQEDGFFMQDARADDDARTSEALFVSTGTPPTSNVGDVVEVTAPVRERRTSCARCPSAAAGVPAHLSVTELEAPRSIRLLSRGQPLPAPVRIGSGGRLPPAAITAHAAGAALDDPFTPLAPLHDALDFYESLEGMLVELHDARVVGPTWRVAGRSVLTLFPELAAPRGPSTAAGGVLVSEGTLNPERLLLASTPEVPLPSATVGDRFDGGVRGVLTYVNGRFELLPCAALPPLARSFAARKTGTLPAPNLDELRVAVLNVHNLAATQDASRFSALAELITVHLGSPDLLGLLEVQDDNGAEDDAWVGAEQTLSRLTAAIRVTGGPTYAARSIDPRDDADGGEPGANVRSVLLFRADRGLGFVDRPGASPDTANFVEETGARPRLAFSPGRLAPSNPAFVRSRKPLAAELTFRGQALFVVLVHLTSKLGDTALFDRVQPSSQLSALRREAQARVVAELGDALFARDPDAKLMVLGDFNDFEFSPALTLLRGARLTPVIERLPRSQRYTYVFDGNSQALDHILLSPALVAGISGVDVVHRHADFPTRITDHDPVVLQLRF